MPEAKHVAIPKKCNVLVLGRQGSGKSTVANHLVGARIFQRLDQRFAKKHHVALEESGNIYDVQLVVSYGMFDDIEAIRTHVKDKLDSISLVIFVTNNDNLPKEEENAFKFYARRYKASSISQISALVITHCEGINGDKRRDLDRMFKNNSPTDSIAQFMGKGIYRVGLPTLSTVPEDLRPIYEGVATTDTTALRKMMFESTNKYAFDDVFPKLPWLHQRPFLRRAIQVFALMVMFIILAPLYHQILHLFL